MRLAFGAGGGWLVFSALTRHHWVMHSARKSIRNPVVLPVIMICGGFLLGLALLVAYWLRHIK